MAVRHLLRIGPELHEAHALPGVGEGSLKRITEMLGGSIGVYSVSGRGTTVVVEIPSAC